MKNSKSLLILISVTFLTACGSAGDPAKQLAATSIENLGCKASQSEMWNTLHKIAEEGGSYPSAATVRKALLEAYAAKGLKGEKFENYIETFVEAYGTAIEGIEAKLAPRDLESWKKALAEMEIGVRVTSVHSELQDALQPALSKLEIAEKETGAECEEPEAHTPTPVVSDNTNTVPPKADGTIWEQIAAEEDPEVVGARRTLATAYQSCDVLSLPAMTSATPSVQGIKVVGNHPAGGLKREISSIASVNSSHYYIKNNRLAKNTCFEIRNSPLIYDFGGKPATSASKPNLLDFFRNGGSGTAVLGFDCSAFVFSSFALSGLKMDPDPKKPLKADLVHGIGSRAFKEPQSNGLRCLAKITVSKTNSIKSGDVAAINGHVVMLDDVGTDPFGLNKITKAEDCTSSKILTSNWNFTIAQSSPSKSGIGINRFAAKDYLKESSTYKNGLMNYAVAACRAKFGLSATVDTTNLSVVRHKKTAECKAPALQANKEDCVDSCKAL